MVFRYFVFIILMITIFACNSSVQKPFIGIKMNPLYERDMNQWSIKNSITVTDAPSWYPIKIYLGDSWRRAHLRVRGDLARHWREPTKSFRISLDGNEWKGMSEFDLIIPEDKGFELEAVAYEWASLLRLLVPYYEFIDVQLNHKKLGTYFLMERWTDSSFINRGRPVGEFIGENNAWLNVLDSSMKSLYKNVSSKKDSPNPLSIEPEIYRAFRQRTSSQWAMTKFSKMLFEMKDGRILWDRYIDRDASARWTALVLTLGSIHPTFGDNLRWVYSAETKLFSPLLYDVIIYKRDLKKNSCLSEPFAKANIWINLWMQDPFMKQKIKYWLGRIHNDPDMILQKTWHIVESNFIHEPWTPKQLAIRENIQSQIHDNIILGRKHLHKGGCL